MARRSSRTSSRVRLTRLQAEAAATEAEKKAKKAAKKATKSTSARKTTRSRKSTEPVRMRYVWQVQVKGEVVDQFNYSQRAEAAAEAASLSKETGREHEVVKAKVAMDQ